MNVTASSTSFYENFGQNLHQIPLLSQQKSINKFLEMFSLMVYFKDLKCDKTPYFCKVFPTM